MCEYPVGKGLKIYGCSDDLIEVEGQTNDEFECLDCKLEMTFIDGTKVIWDYDDNGIWRVEVMCEGELFDKVDINPEDDDERYSDVLYIKHSEECSIKSVNEI